MSQSENSSPPFSNLGKWWSKQPGNVRGALWMLLAAALFAVMVALIKAVGERLPVVEILLFRQIAMVAIISPKIWAGFPNSFKTKRLDLQLTRIGFAVCAMILGFSAFIHLPLAQATAIGFSKVLFITVLAILFLGETVGIRRWTAVIVGFIGVLIMVFGRGGEFSFTLDIYALMAIGGAACAASVMIIIRKLTKVDEPMTILTYQAVFVGLLMLLPTIYFWVTPTLEELLLCALIGVVSVVAQFANINAYKDGEATAVSFIDYTRLIYAAAIGYFVFAEIPSLTTFIGASIIIGASLYTMHREAQQGKKIARTKESRVYNQ